MAVAVKIGDRIKELRIEKSVSQSSLAHKLGMSKTTISNYETNYSVPSRTNLKKLSEFFDVNIDYILGETDFKDRFVAFTPARKVPHYNLDDIEGIITASTSKIAGIDDIPSFGQEKLSDSFSVTMPDNSMDTGGICSNARVYILRGSNVPNTRIGAVLYKEQIYIRRIHYYENHITLIPDSRNKSFMPIQVDKSEIIILGRAVKTLNDLN